jgi:primosomal protein N' (replication factor Y)
LESKNTGMFAEVILNNNAKALNKIFDYEVPKDLERKAHVGARVFVPFGKSKKLEDGFIISLKESSDYANKPLATIENQDFMNEAKINLAKLMARKYFCNISECIKLMLPPGTSAKDIDDRMKEKKGNFVFLLKSKDEIEILIDTKNLKSDKQIRALRFLYQNDGIYITDLEVLADVSHSVLKTLEKNGYIEIREGVIQRNPFIHKNIVRDEAKILTDEQQVCFDGIKYSIEHNSFSNNLIYGITGSRKNRNLFKIDRNCFKIK